MRRWLPLLTWVAVDALGRALPTHDDVGDPRPSRTAGIFYVIKKTEADVPIFDISNVLAADTQEMSKRDGPRWGPEGRLHYWTEPLLGYYGQTD